MIECCSPFFSFIFIALLKCQSRILIKSTSTSASTSSTVKFTGMLILLKESFADVFESLTYNPDYPVKIFEGTKSVVFTNVSWMGGKNQFLGIAYLVIGSLCIVMAIVMLIVYAKYKFSDDDSA